MEEKRFLTLTEVGEELNVTQAQVYAMVRLGNLPGIKIGGRGQWRIECSKLEEYISRSYKETKYYTDNNPLIKDNHERKNSA